MPEFDPVMTAVLPASVILSSCVTISSTNIAATAKCPMAKSRFGGAAVKFTQSQALSPALSPTQATKKKTPAQGGR
jgi:hypothetical protein